MRINAHRLVDSSSSSSSCPCLAYRSWLNKKPWSVVWTLVSGFQKMQKVRRHKHEQHSLVFGGGQEASRGKEGGGINPPTMISASSATIVQATSFRLNIHPLSLSPQTVLSTIVLQIAPNKTGGYSSRGDHSDPTASLLFLLLPLLLLSSSFSSFCLLG